MEAEILQTLKEIRGVLYIIAAIFFVGFSILAVNSLVAILNLKKAYRKSWKDKAIEYFDTGEFDDLVAHCKEREITHKNDSNAYYWLARVYHQRGDLEKANEYFAKVSKISPEWHREYVLPFIENE